MKRSGLFVAALATVILHSSLAPAVSLTWDPSFAGGSDGSGTWDAVSTNWWNGTADTNWTSANPDSATFGAGGTAGTVSLGAAITVSNITFAPVSGGSYLIQSNTLTLSGASTVTANTNGTISSALAGGALNKSGSATLTIGGASIYTGATTVNNGTLMLQTPSTISPANIPGLFIQLDANNVTGTGINPTNGAIITTWSNLVTSVGGNFTGGTAVFNPGAYTMNGKPVVHFYGTTFASFASIPAPCTILYVGRMNGGANYRLLGSSNVNFLLGYWSGYQDEAYFGGPSFVYNPNGAVNYGGNLYEGVIPGTGTNSSFYQNGLLQAANQNSVSGPGIMTLGGGNGSGANTEVSYGDVGEVLVFTNALTAAQRLQAEQYLQAKWQGALPAVSRVNLAASTSVFNLNGVNQQIGSLSGVSGSSVLLNGGQLSAGMDNTSTTNSGTMGDGGVGGGIFTKNGSGSLTLAGASSNTYTGTTVVASGALILSMTGGATAIPGNLIINGANGNVWATANNQLGGSNTVVSSADNIGWGSLTLLGTTQTIAGLNNPASGIMVANSTTSSGTPSPTGTGTGTVVLAGSGSYTFAGDLWDYWGANGGKLALVMNGSGTQTFSSAQITYSGATTINQGVVTIAPGGSLPNTATITIGSGSTLNLSATANNQIQSGQSGTGTLNINGTLAVTTPYAHSMYPSTITMSNGTIITTGGPNAGNGNFYFFANRTITASGPSNTISGNGNIGVNGVTVTLNTPLSADAAAISIPIVNITAAGSITKTGLGTVTLTATNTYTGTTTVNGGTLSLQSPNACTNATTINSGVLQLGANGSITSSPVIFIGTNATFDVSPIIGSFNPGSFQTLEGFGSVTGNVTGVNGTKIVAGLIGTPGTLTFNGNLYFSAGMTNYFDLAANTTIGGGTNDLIVVNGNFEPSNSVIFINPLNGKLTNGTYRLVNYSGTKTTTFNPVFLNYATRDIVTIDETTPGQVNLDVTNGPPANLLWSPYSSFTWDSGATIDNNWINQATTNQDNFFDLDNVTFDDSGTLIGATVTISGNVQPTTITVNSSTNYVFNGSGSINNVTAVPVTLTKNGSGSLTIATTNGYAGSTLINNGTLAVSSSSALGVSAVTLNDGGLLTQSGGSFTVSNSVAIPGTNVVINDGGNTFTLSGPISGSAAINKTGAGTLSLNGTNTFTSPLTISAGTLAVGGAGVLGGGTYSAAITNNGTFVYGSSVNQTNSGIISGTGIVSMTGSSTLTLSGSSANTYTGTTTVNAGNLILSKNSGVAAVPGNITLNGTATTAIWMTQNGQLGGNGVLTINGGASFNSWFLLNGTTQSLAGIVETDSSQNGVIENGQSGSPLGTSSNPGTLILTGAGSYSYNGYFRNYDGGVLNIMKNGSGTQTLVGTRISYSGATTINQGTITIGSGGSLPGTTNIFIGAGATLNLSGSANNEIQSAAASPILTVNGMLAATTAYANTLYATTITLNGGTMTSTGGAPSDYGVFFASGSRTITANGTGNTISGNGKFGVASGAILTLSTPLTGDVLGVSAVLGYGASGTAGGLTKSGLGTVNLNSNNAYAGTTTINAGTLALGATGSITGTPLINISTGALFDVSSIGNYALGNFQSLEGGGIVTGSVTMAAGGRLIPGTLGTAGTLSFANDLDLNAGTTNYFDLTSTTGVGGGTNDLVTVGGNLGGSNSTIAVSLLAPPTNGTYVLFTYGGVLTSNFNPAVLGNTTRSAWTLNQSVANQITLGVTNTGGSNLLWRAYANTNWDFASTNWLDGATQDIYFDGDNVTFDDIGAVLSNVNLTARFVPGAVTVNSASNYVFGGNGGLAGTASLTKSGAGTLTLNTTNTFTGPISINAGTLAINRSDSFSFSNVLSGAGTFYKQAVNTLTYGGTSTNFTGTIDLAGGAFTVTNGASVTGLGTAKQDGGTETCVWNVNGVLSASSFAGAYESANYGGSYSTVNVYPVASVMFGTATMSRNAWDEGGVPSTTFNVNGAMTATTINSGGQDGGSISPSLVQTINVNTGGQLNSTTINLSNGQTGNNNINLNGGTLANIVGGNLTVDSTTPVTLTGSGLFSPSSGQSITVNGIVQGSGSLIENGVGTLILPAVNTCTGPTVISNGTLIVNGSISTGAVSVVSGATLGGTGVVNGAVTSDGTVSPGPAAFSAGILTLAQGYTQATNGTLNIELGGAVQGTGYACLVVSNTAALNGALNVSFINNYLPSGSNTYTILTAGSIGGTFASTNLSLPVGLSLAVQYTPTSVVLTVTGSADTLVWQPTVAANWDLTSSNWYYTVASVTGLYSQSSTVVFNDTGAYSNNVNLALPLLPGGVTVNSSSNYFLSGAGWLAGSMSLTKTGTGVLVMSTTNTYTGPTTINGGTLTIAGAGVLGGGSYSSAITNKGALNFASSTNQTLNGIVTGTGTLSQSGSGTLTLSGGSINYTGGTIVSTGTLRTVGATAFASPSTVNSNATLQIDNNGTTMGIGSTAATIILNGGTLSYTSSGNYWTTWAAATTNQGVASVISIAPGGGGNSGLFLDGGLKGSGTITVNNFTAGAGLNLRNGNTTFAGTVIVNGIASTTAGVGSGIGIGGANTALNNIDFMINGTMEILTKGIGWADSGTSASFGALNGTGVVVGNYSGGGVENLTLGNTGSSGSFSGVIANGVGNTMSLIKTGAGTQTLSGTNAYTGTTTINAGALVIGGSGTLNGGSYATNITDNGSFTYGSTANQILAGVISGTGSLTKTNVGTLTLTAACSHSGGTTVSNGTLIVSGLTGTGAVTLASGTMLGGTGVVSGAATSSGSISPGISTNIGSLAFGSDYTQVSNGVLNIKAADGSGANNDELYVTGTANLGGTLSVTPVNGYAPALGDYLFIVQAGTVSGGFAVTNLPALTSGLAWSATSGGGFYYLQVVTNSSPPPPTGYAAWAAQITSGQTNYNQSATGDGYPNLLKYATGSSPTQSDSLAQMNAARAGGILSLNFNWNTNATDVSLIVEGSTSAANGSPWTGITSNMDGTGWLPTNGVTVTGSGVPVSVSVADNVLGATNRFLRLRVTQP